MQVQRYGSAMLWGLLGFLSFLLDESNITVLAFLARDHRPLRNNVGDSDIESGGVLLVALPPGLPGVPAYPIVTRLADLNLVRTAQWTEMTWRKPFHIIVGIIGSQSFRRFP